MGAENTMAKVKFRVGLFLLLIIVASALGAHFSLKNLVLKNIENYPISNRTKAGIEKAYFDFGERHLPISLDELRQKFSYCEDIEILPNSMLYEQKLKKIGEFWPLFTFKKQDYLFYVIFENSTEAGGESLISESHYIWLVWDWYKIKNEITGAA